MTSKRKKLLLLFFIPEVLFIAFLVFNALFPLPPLKSYSTLVLARDGSVLNAYLSTDDKWRMETKINDVSPDLVKAVLAKEDKYFYYHPGINLVAVTRAMFSNLFHLKRTSGASTITMQLAKMFTYSRRTYGNKFVEMFRAMQLESEYSKDEILTLYLSYLPYGGNIEGIPSV